MSYSFGIRAASKEAAIAAVHEEINKVVVNQPVHQLDSVSAKEAAAAFVELLAADETRDVVVNVTGSVWVPETGPAQVSVSVSAQLSPKL